MPDHPPERPHDPEHDHAHSRLSETELRVRALESVLTQKGYVDPAALDLLIETYETKIDPHNGARNRGRVAKWSADVRDQISRLRSWAKDHAG